MVTTVYLVRHAAAQGNILKTFQGRIDADLCGYGFDQLEALTKRFENIHIDKLYSSPLKRARLTANAVKPDMPIELCPDIMEIDGGGFENVKYEDLPNLFPEEYNKWTYHMGEFVAPCGGESIADVYERMSKALTEIAADNLGKTIAVVSHGCAIRAFLCFAKKMNYTDIMKEEWADNTAVAKLIFDENDGFSIEYENCAKHLSPEISTFSHQDWWIPVEEK